ncbi:hypothetical protein Chor_006481 [Crotalus horridus]
MKLAKGVVEFNKNEAKQNGFAVGIGKTTLVRKAAEILKSSGIPIDGFYTEEVREGSRRTGFDVVTLNGRRGILSRVGSGHSAARHEYRVGQYVVDLASFEQLALPLLRNVRVDDPMFCPAALTENFLFCPAASELEPKDQEASDNTDFDSSAMKKVCIIDEIGKMELFSQTFIQAVQQILNGSRTVILGTIPVPKGKPLRLVEEIRNRKEVKLFSITRENRDAILQEVVTAVESCLK